MEPTDDYIGYLQQEWSISGALVLRDHGVGSDLEAIQEWVSWFIVNGRQDQDYELILSRIDHSLNLDIPFAATSTVRESLISTVRSKLKDPLYPHAR
ncbi:hypothetical protein [Shinella oryzae]|uniref:hypothetical protein n=1 Tax=Shinella oryzae TaxID=2871820 RepID=UPI001FF46840|nr:hypothetical protein [Shinella oryzae]